MLQALKKYLENKNWVLQREGERFLFYKPPVELGFDEKYLLPVPKISTKEDFNPALQDTIKLIANIYEVDINEITHDVTNYFEILKKDAMYFKLQSENLMFQQTLEVNDIWNFLKNLSTSYTNYVKVEFAKNFYPVFGADNDRIKKSLNKLLDLTRLRVVALEYASFSVGVSADNFMGKNEIEIKEIQEWRGQIVKNYKNDVIEVNFDSIEQVDSILQKFNDEERRKIFDPLVSSINNTSDYFITLTDSAFSPKKKLKRIPSQTVDILIPSEPIKETPKKIIGLYQTILPIDESKSAIKLKVREIEENSLFTKKLDEVEAKVSKLTYRDTEIKLKKDIDCLVRYNESDSEFVANIKELDINIRLVDLNSLQSELDSAFEKLIDLYFFREQALDEKGVKIKEYLSSILPENMRSN